MDYAFHPVRYGAGLLSPATVSAMSFCRPSSSGSVHSSTTSHSAGGGVSGTSHAKDAVGDSITTQRTGNNQTTRFDPHTNQGVSTTTTQNNSSDALARRHLTTTTTSAATMSPQQYTLKREQLFQCYVHRLVACGENQSLSWGQHTHTLLSRPTSRLLRSDEGERVEGESTVGMVTKKEGPSKHCGEEKKKKMMMMRRRRCARRTCGLSVEAMLGRIVLRCGEEHLARWYSKTRGRQSHHHNDGSEEQQESATGVLPQLLFHRVGWSEECNELQPNESDNAHNCGTVCTNEAVHRIITSENEQRDKDSAHVFITQFPCYVCDVL